MATLHTSGMANWSYSMLHDGDIAILRGPEVRAVLSGRELELIQVVRRAYETHGDGDSSLPHSCRSPKFKATAKEQSCQHVPNVLV